MSDLNAKQDENLEESFGEFYPLALSEVHAEACHRRWKAHRMRTQEMLDHPESMPDHWSTNQCGKCRFYIPVMGKLSSDYGVCSNPASPNDRQAMFEHDGCDYFVEATGWVVGIVGATRSGGSEG
jgi:Protein of unknown function (DUF3027)